MIRFEDVHKSFGPLKVLQGIDLTIEKGQSLVILGRSGSGKSVMLKHVVALLQPDRGKVIVDEQNIFDFDHDELMGYRKRLGILFQFGALFDSMTVAENVGFALKESLRYPKDKIENIVEEKLDMVGLSGIQEKMPSELSGGMKKRVALARAISTEPEILLYDEPTTGLDPITADLINELIVDVNQKMGVTSIAVTHDLASAFKIADRIIMLYEGKILADSTPDEIENTDDPVVRQFISGSYEGPITDNE